jgi:hypothetical protein
MHSLLKAMVAHAALTQAIAAVRSVMIATEAREQSTARRTDET